MNEISWDMHFNENSNYQYFNKTQRPPERPDRLTSN